MEMAFPANVELEVAIMRVFACCRWPGSVTDGFGEDDGQDAESLKDFEPARADQNGNSDSASSTIDFNRTQTGSA